MVNRLVFENLKHRPVRTLLSAIMIGLQVTMILTLVGLSEGVLGDIAQRSRGTGADIVIYPSGSSILAFSGNMDERLVKVSGKSPHVAIATGASTKPLAISMRSTASISRVQRHERRDSISLRRAVHQGRRADRRPAVCGANTSR